MPGSPEYECSDFSTILLFYCYARPIPYILIRTSQEIEQASFPAVWISD